MNASNHLVALVLLAAAPLASAQWDSIPHNPLKTVESGANFVQHETTAGIEVFSAIAQEWTVLSPPGATVRKTGGSFVLTAEAGNILRGWSALRNASSAQAVSTNHQVVADFAGECVVVVDRPGTANALLRAYSAVTNTWSSVTLSTLNPTNLTFVSRFAAASLDGNRYHVYTAHSGQWRSLDVTQPGLAPQVRDHMVLVDLAGQTGLGPRQIAAFSAIRATWALSPLYPSVGDPGLSAGINTTVVRVASPNPTQFSFAGYSPFRGTWTTSPSVHLTSSTVSVGFHRNLHRVEDSDVSMRFEVFGAGTGTWAQLAGSNLTDEGLRADFTCVRDDVADRLYATSGLAGGTWTSIGDPSTAPSTLLHPMGTSTALATTSDKMWGYSALTNSFAGPIVRPVGATLPAAVGSSVVGFNVQGIGATGTNAQAFSARWGSWVAGPPMSASVPAFTMGTGSVLTCNETTPTTFEVNIFDEHANSWQPPLILTRDYSTSAIRNAVIARSTTPGAALYAYSAQRGDWTSPGGAILVGAPVVQDNVVWFVDNMARLWAFGTPDRAQTWSAWPLGLDFPTSGPVPPGGTAPYLGLSVHGRLGEIAVLYAAFTLAPSPIPIPGLSGGLDLDPLGLIYLANLGAFDADGILEYQLPVPIHVPQGTRFWFQPILFDPVAPALGFGGRASGVVVF